MDEYSHRLLSSQIEEAARYYPVIVITGPRQSGKTCLCPRMMRWGLPSGIYDEDNQRGAEGVLRVRGPAYGAPQYMIFKIL